MKAPHLGFGLGLRHNHYPYIFEQWPAIDWFEIISENFMDTDGLPKRNLARIAERYPIVMHGVALSIGTIDPLNSEYLQKLKKLISWVKPAWISDHLCWTGIAHQNTHDLLPVPYTEEALKHVIKRIKEVQDFLERPLALENPSTYLEFKSSAMPEAEFIARMAEGSGCQLLLDVNNVYVTCYNHRLDPKTYIDTLPLDVVSQIHLSGHTNKGTHIIDTHDDHVVDEVWALYQYVLKKAGRIPNTMVEWDDHIPEFPVLEAELTKARKMAVATQDAPLPNLFKEQTVYVKNSLTPLQEEQMHMQKSIYLGHAMESLAADWIRSKDQFAPQDQLNVYINAYRARLYDVTAEDYPALKHYLGEQRFDELLNSFIENCPSDHFNIGRFSAKLPAYLAKKGAKDTFALELCNLEKALSQLTDPKETTPLTAEHLAGLTPESLLKTILYPREALELFHFEYQVNRYYQAFQNEHPLSQAEKISSYLAVFRHEDRVWRMDLEAEEFVMLQMLFQGMTVGTALEQWQSQSALTEAEAMTALSGWFARWMRNGLLAHPDQDNKHLPLHAA